MLNSFRAAGFYVLVSSFVLWGCNEGTQQETETTTDSTTMTTADNNGRRNSGDADRDFVADAVEANAKEIKALKLGQERGGSQVKEAAGMMLTDHFQMGEQMRSYITSKSMALEDVDTNRIDDDYNFDDTGNDFDRKWAEEMVEDHEDVIDLFEDAEDDVKDPELKSMITAALPKLRAHLEHSRQLRDQLGNQNNNNENTGGSASTSNP